MHFRAPIGFFLIKWLASSLGRNHYNPACVIACLERSLVSSPAKAASRRVWGKSDQSRLSEVFSCDSLVPSTIFRCFGAGQFIDTYRRL